MFQSDDVIVFQSAYGKNPTILIKADRVAAITECDDGKCQLWMDGAYSLVVSGGIAEVAAKLNFLPREA